MLLQSSGITETLSEVVRPPTPRVMFQDADQVFKRRNKGI